MERAVERQREEDESRREPAEVAGERVDKESK